MENKLSNINRTNEVLENLRNAGKPRDVVAPYAFGLAWAYLTEKARDEVIKASERILKESKGE
jgi:hypothetical protein